MNVRSAGSLPRLIEVAALGVGAGDMRQAYGGQQGFNIRLRHVGGHNQLDVFRHCQPWQQPRFLEHHADAVAVAPHMSFERFVQSEQDAQHRAT